uniref:Uncharacterized protein n=1 Tax=Anguilla anguilla TaxID=7936 RepID=A0A0E9SGS0_ANGAN
MNVNIIGFKPFVIIFNLITQVILME